MITLRKTVAAVALLSACADFRYDRRADSDTVCEAVGQVQVRLRSEVVAWPSLLTCRDAREIVQNALTVRPLARSWQVIFTASDAGMTDRGPANATTYPMSQIIICSAIHPEVLHHEFNHAADVEAGRANHRDLN